MILLDGKIVATKIKEQVAKTIQLNKQKFESTQLVPTTPPILDIQVGDNKSSNIYVKQKQKLFAELGIGFSILNFDETISQETLELNIINANQDNNIRGVFIEQPLPNRFDSVKLINLLDPDKDIESITNYNLGALFNNQPAPYPCTAEAIIKILDYYNINIDGKNCVVVGRSNIVGKPAALLSLYKNATVTICHTHTKNLKEICRQADIVIAAAGQPLMLTEDYFNSFAIVVDAGINYKDNKIVGDVDFENVKNKVAAITPVPGGVGSVTTALLAQHYVNLILNNN